MSVEAIGYVSELNSGCSVGAEGKHSSSYRRGRTHTRATFKYQMAACQRNTECHGQLFSTKDNGGGDSDKASQGMFWFLVPP